MKLAPVVTSLLDTDLYKFTMLQTFLHQFPAATGEYRFVCRGGVRVPLGSFQDEIASQIDHLCTLRFREEELDYLRGLRFLSREHEDLEKHHVHERAARDDVQAIVAALRSLDRDELVRTTRTRSCESAFCS